MSNENTAYKSSTPYLPYDIVKHIIDVLAGDGNLTPVKNFSLTNSSVLHLCRRHIFHTIPHNTKFLNKYIKKPFISLLVNNPAIAQYIRVLGYQVGADDNGFSPLLPDLLRTISHLEYLRISNYGGRFEWTEMDPSLQSALLRLMHLPTLTHLGIGRIYNIPIPALTPCANLKQLDIDSITIAPFEDSDYDGSQPSKIIRFTTDSSQAAVEELLRVKWNDGRSIFDFTHIKTLALDFDMLHDDDYQVTGELFENIGHLERLRINVQDFNDSLAGLAAAIPVNACRTLQITMILNDSSLGGLCEELEIMAGNNVLQGLEFTFSMDGCETDEVVEPAFTSLERVLMDPRWTALTHVSIEIVPRCCYEQLETLKEIPDKFLGRLLGRKILDYKCPDSEPEQDSDSE